MKTAEHQLFIFSILITKQYKIESKVGNCYSAGHTAEDHIRTDISWFNWSCLTGGFLLLWKYSVAILCESSCLFYLSFNSYFYVSKIMHL